MHAILTSLGTDGDIFPYLGLTKELVERGHRVTLVVPESFESLANAAGAEFRPIVTRDETEALFTNPNLWHPVKGGYVMARWGRTFIARQFELLSPLVSDGQTIIVANPGVLAARIIRDLHKIPLVSLVLQPGVIPSNVAPPVLPAGPRLSPHAPRLIKESYWWMIDQFANLLTGRELNRVRQAQGLPPVHRLFRWWLSPDLVLGMFPKWWDWNRR